MPKERLSSGPRTRRASGFTLIEIIITVAIIGSIAAIAANAVMRARDKAATTTCISNLEQLSRAKTLWSIETKSAPSAVPVDADIFGASNFIKIKPACPMNGAYTLGAISDNPTCTIPGHVLPP